MPLIRHIMLYACDYPPYWNLEYSQYNCEEYRMLSAIPDWNLNAFIFSLYTNVSRSYLPGKYDIAYHAYGIEYNTKSKALWVCYICASGNLDLVAFSVLAFRNILCSSWGIISRFKVKVSNVFFEKHLHFLNKFEMEQLHSSFNFILHSTLLFIQRYSSFNVILL